MVGPRLRESRLLAPSGSGGEFTQPRAHLLADPCRRVEISEITMLSLGICSRLDHQVVWDTNVGDGGRQEMGRPGRLRKLQEEHPHPGSFLKFNRDWIIWIFLRGEQSRIGK